jgi:putative oxidoreductase
MRREAGLAELAPFAYALLVARLALGILHVGHAAMMSSVMGFSAWWAYALMGGEVAGAALLFAGLYTRQAAIALVAVLLGAAWLHLATGMGASVEFGIYFIVTLAGQALLIGWTALPAADDETLS